MNFPSILDPHEQNASETRAWHFWVNYVFIVIVFWVALHVLSFPLVAYLSEEVPGYPANPAYRTVQFIIDISESGGFPQEKMMQIDQDFLRLSVAHPDTLFDPDYYTVGRNGIYLPKHSLLATLVGVPFYWVMGESGIWLLSSLLLAALFLIPVFLIQGRVQGRFVVSAVTTITIILFGTDLLNTYSAQYSYDILGTVLLLAGAHLMVKHPWLAGCLIGITLGCRITNLFWFVPLFFIFMPMRMWRQQWKPYLIGLTAGTVLILTMNAWFYGHPLTAGYEDAPMYLNGEMLQSVHSHQFSISILVENLNSRLFSGPQALWTSFPAVFFLLPICACYLFWQLSTHFRNPDIPFLLLLCSSLTHIAIFLAFSYWEGSGGSRFVMFPVLLLIIAGILVFVKYTAASVRSAKSAET